MHIALALRSTMRPLVVGLPMMILPTLGGYPGVACVTPMFWLLALWVGGYCAEQSENHIADAALGGLVLGLIFGAVSALIFVFAFDVRPDERAQTTLLAAIMTLGSIAACAIIAPVFAAFTRRRIEARRAQDR